MKFSKEKQITTSIKYLIFSLAISLVTLSVDSATAQSCNSSSEKTCCSKAIVMGAERVVDYSSLLKDKRVGLVVNQTSTIGKVHTVDFLISENIDIESIYAPEHGFRGDEDAGAKISDSVDPKTGVKVLSLYGKSKKPSVEMLKGIDIMIFDIQDVGCRFYTYISTLHYVMEACAENSIPVVVLDRPNPNGDYIAGPILESRYRSFVGMHPIPIVHGCTVGEIALMINGEGWLPGAIKADLKVIKCLNYRHTTPYSLPIKPSPNLPNDISIRLYPSLCLFEASSISIGRGTEMPFQIAGYPNSEYGSYIFTPKSIKGMSSNPRHKDKTCYGIDYRTADATPKFTLALISEWIDKMGSVESVITNEQWFNKLMGEGKTLTKLKAGVDYRDIEKSWEPQLNSYRTMREQYMLYP